MATLVRKLTKGAPRRVTPAVQRAIWGAAEPTAEPLIVPLEDVYSPEPAFVGATETKVTTLDNGFRVASSDVASPACTVGVYVEAGSRYDTFPGVAHVMQHMAFKSSASRSQLKMVRDSERLGAMATCTTSRESIAYQVETLKESVPEVVAMLAETTVAPKLLPWEVSAQATAIKTELKDLSDNPHGLLQELMHPAAYGAASPLGKPLHVKASELSAIDASILGDFVSKEFVPGKMVLAAAGYEHDELVKLAKAHFGGLTKPEAAPAIGGGDKYVGGEVRTSGDSPMTHFGLAFEAAGWTSKSLVPTCVLATLMGGGHSFSAGGPGKGMYTRLYQNILSRHPSVEAAMVFNAFYRDTGLFGVYGAAPPEVMGSLVAALVDEMKKMAASITDAELSRAKNQLASSLLMNLESRSVLFEDIARQVLVYGARESPEALVKQIEAVTSADLKTVASAMLKTPPSVAVYGDTTCVPRYDLIAKQFA